MRFRFIQYYFDRNYDFAYLQKYALIYLPVCNNSAVLLPKDRKRFDLKERKLLALEKPICNP